MVMVAAFALAACGDNGGVVITPTPTQAGSPGGDPTAATPTEAPATPTEAPATPTEAAATPTEVPTDTPTPAPAVVRYEAKYDTVKAFFEDAVYCGDSLMNFYQWRGNQYITPNVFGSYNAKVWLAVNSFSAKQAISETINETDPKLSGEGIKLWNAIPQLEKHQVFLFFGLNDIGVTGVDQFVENYETLIHKLEATGFAANYYVLSITSMRYDKQSTTGGLTNEKIKEANGKLEQMCAANGWRFVDVASNLRDADYNLLLEYSDGTNVHIIKEGYVFWDNALKAIAEEFLK